MNNRNVFLLAAALVALGAQGAVAADSGALPERKEIADEYKWQLSDIYATDAEWESDCEKLREELPRLAAMSGKLAQSEKNLLDCLKLEDEISIRFGKIYAYATMMSHEDTADSTRQARAAKASALTVEVSAAGSFVTPEIIALPKEQFMKYIEEGNKGGAFKDYTFRLREILRQSEHVLSLQEEAILSRTGEMAGVASETYSMLTDADMRFPFIKDESGKKIELSEERYGKFIRSRKRSVRKAAFDALYDTYAKSNNAIGATFNGMLKSSRFYADVRRYESDIAMALDAGNIPLAVYDNLVDTVEKNLEPLHRYMSLRKKALKLDELHLYDIYTPLVDDPYGDVRWDDAKKMAVEALQPLGAEYMKQFEEGLKSGWIDVYPNRGKRGGAYSWGSYGTHPYILLNYNDELSDVMTLVHEMGHSMHSFYSHENQPVSTADYTIFCAEVASTTNEELTLSHLLATTQDKKKRIYLLNQRLERVRSTLYRQVMFASFERDIHQRFQMGMDTTAEQMGKMWISLNKKYFGPETVIDEAIALEWSRIPHFYRPFYVYQYATGYSAAASLVKGILTEGEPARQRYLNFLKAGGSDYSIELLKGAGVDMSTPKPIEDAIASFSESIDEMEKLLKEIGAI